MIKLIAYPAGLGFFSPSSFCVKAAYLLQLSSKEWEREDLSDPCKMPQGKLPAIRVGGVSVRGRGVISALSTV